MVQSKSTPTLKLSTLGIAHAHSNTTEDSTQQEVPCMASTDDRTKHMDLPRVIDPSLVLVLATL